MGSRCPIYPALRRGQNATSRFCSARCRCNWGAAGVSLREPRRQFGWPRSRKTENAFAAEQVVVEGVAAQAGKEVATGALPGHQPIVQFQAMRAVRPTQSVLSREEPGLGRPDIES